MNSEQREKQMPNENEEKTYLLLETIENTIIDAHNQGVDVDIISSAIDELLYNLSMGREGTLEDVGGKGNFLDHR